MDVEAAVFDFVYCTKENRNVAFEPFALYLERGGDGTAAMTCLATMTFQTEPFEDGNKISHDDFRAIQDNMKYFYQQVTEKATRWEAPDGDVALRVLRKRIEPKQNFALAGVYWFLSAMLDKVGDAFDVHEQFSDEFLSTLFDYHASMAGKFPFRHFLLPVVSRQPKKLRKYVVIGYGGSMVCCPTIHALLLSLKTTRFETAFARVSLQMDVKTLLKAYIASNPSTINEEFYGTTPLQYAVTQKMDPEIIAVLKAQGQSPHS